MALHSSCLYIYCPLAVRGLQHFYAGCGFTTALGTFYSSPILHTHNPPLRWVLGRYVNLLEFLAPTYGEASLQTILLKRWTR